MRQRTWAVLTEMDLMLSRELISGRNGIRLGTAPAFLERKSREFNWLSKLSSLSWGALPSDKATASLTTFDKGMPRCSSSSTLTGTFMVGERMKSSEKSGIVLSLPLGFSASTYRRTRIKECARVSKYFFNYLDMYSCTFTAS